MHKNVKRLFLFLVLVQAVHSVEEYFGGLWEVFPPANLLCRLVFPSNLNIGFLIINIGLFVFGMRTSYHGVSRSLALLLASIACFFGTNYTPTPPVFVFTGGAS